MNLCVVFKALGDDTRLRILGLLAQRELCECQLCFTLGISQPNASKHLKCMRYAGMISCRKISQWCFYSISEEFKNRFGTLCAFLVEQWQNESPYREDIQKLQQLLRTKKCCGMALIQD